MAYDVNNFQTEVIDRSHQIPVLVDFWADWCGPCRVLGPVLEKLAAENSGKWELAKVDTEQHRELSAQYGIRSIPNVKLFVEGKVVDEFSGALPEAAITQWLDRVLPSPYRAMLAEAHQLIGSGQNDEARRILEKIVAAEPGNEEARIRLAGISLYLDASAARMMVADIDMASKFSTEAESIRAFADLLEKDVDQLPGGEGTAGQRYRAGIECLGAQDFEGALQSFIDVIEVDRNYDDDGARKACIAIFKYLGEDHALTKQFRSAFSSALYV